MSDIHGHTFHSCVALFGQVLRDKKKKNTTMLIYFAFVSLQIEIWQEQRNL